jgi:hypothetical protein
MGSIARSGKRALGIAQFMPGTAAERNLQNPLDPVQALPKSAEFLRDLRGEFGNLGLAAAAYNAGPRRVREWMAGFGSMPLETRNYVIAITGAPIEQWSKARTDVGRIQETGLAAANVALLDRPPNRFVAALEKRPIAGAMQSRDIITGVDISRARTLGKYAKIQTRDAAVLAGKDPILLEPGRGPPPRYQVRFVSLSRRYLNEGGPPGATFKVVTPPRAIASLPSRMP